MLVRTRHRSEAERHLQDVYYERGITQAERQQLEQRVAQALNNTALRPWYEHPEPVMIQRTLLTGDQRYVWPRPGDAAIVGHRRASGGRAVWTSRRADRAHAHGGAKRGYLTAVRSRFGEGLLGERADAEGK